MLLSHADSVLASVFALSAATTACCDSLLRSMIQRHVKPQSSTPRTVIVSIGVHGTRLDPQRSFTLYEVRVELPDKGRDRLSLPVFFTSLEKLYRWIGKRNRIRKKHQD